jgi:glycerol transport system permease protein
MSDRTRARRQDLRGWLGVTPVLLVVAFSAVIPLMTVLNYSVQDIFDVQTRLFVGLDWYRQTLADPTLHDALLRQIGFTSLILVIEVPLGILVGRMMPRDGRMSGALLVLFAIPLLVPWNVVGTIWQIFARPDIGLMGQAVNAIGLDFNYTADPVDAWITLVMLDVWHWTSLVALLTYSGLRAIPDAWYQAAAIDGASAWQTFRYIELPRLRAVLTIAVLLRVMDSLMIYTEPYVLTGGGPGNATTFLSQYLATLAVGQFDLGPAAAFSIIYFLVILLICWAFYTLVMSREEDR